MNTSHGSKRENLRTCLLALILVGALLVLPSPVQARYASGLNLYEYALSAPINYVDWTGKVPASTTTSAPQAQKTDWWGMAAKAVDDARWADAAEYMGNASREWVDRDKNPRVPHGGMPCCCTGHNRNKCHIWVTHLAKIGHFVEAGQVYDPKAAGAPFPAGRPAKVSANIAGIGVITRVQVKHEDGLDTRGCTLHAECRDFVVSKSSNEIKGDVARNDFRGPYWRGRLDVSQGTNWYIDTPLDVGDSPFRIRYFSQHVTVMDENGKAIAGLEAYYGWAALVQFSPINWAKSQVKWVIWPAAIGVPQKDPRRDETLPGRFGPEWRVGLDLSHVKYQRT